jgi:hypothetical protein
MLACLSVSTRARTDICCENRIVSTPGTPRAGGVHGHAKPFDPDWMRCMHVPEAHFDVGQHMVRARQVV